MFILIKCQGTDQIVINPNCPFVNFDLYLREKLKELGCEINESDTIELCEISGKFAMKGLRKLKRYARVSDIVKYGETYVPVIVEISSDDDLYGYRFLFQADQESVSKFNLYEKISSRLNKSKVKAAPACKESPSSTLLGGKKGSLDAKGAKSRVNAGDRDVEKYFNFTGVIVGSVTDSLVGGALRLEQPTEPVDIVKTRQQHSYYVEQMKEVVNGNVVQVPVDERFPDLVFVEDPVFILDGVALLTQMVQPSRAGEVVPMRQILERHGEQLGIKEIHEMKEPGAYLDGGDVLFTGREILVGLSQRTNKAGIAELAKVYPSWPVRGITIQKGVLHLSTMSSMCDIDTISICGHEAGRQAWKEIDSDPNIKYKKVVFPEFNGANCLLMNGVLFHPPKEDCPESFKIWETFKYKLVPLPNSELNKVDGSLTCNSKRIN